MMCRMNPIALYGDGFTVVLNEMAMVMCIVRILHPQHHRHGVPAAHASGLHQAVHEHAVTFPPKEVARTHVVMCDVCTNGVGGLSPVSQNLRRCMTGLKSTQGSRC